MKIQLHLNKQFRAENVKLMTILFANKGPSKLKSITVDSPDFYSRKKNGMKSLKQKICSGSNFQFPTKYGEEDQHRTHTKKDSK
jgi:hypothetical protein